MQQYHRFRGFAPVVGLAAMLLTGQAGFGQQQNVVPDAQIEANVLKALASAPELANQNITTTTVYGTVTLSGVVQDEPLRVKAETLASRAEGVKKVIDELTLGTPAPPQNDSSAQVGTNPNLQSDGSVAPSAGQPNQAAPPPDQAAGAPNPPNNGGSAGIPPQPNATQQRQPTIGHLCITRDLSHTHLLLAIARLPRRTERSLLGKLWLFPTAPCSV